MNTIVLKSLVLSVMIAFSASNSIGSQHMTQKTGPFMMYHTINEHGKLVRFEQPLCQRIVGSRCGICGSLFADRISLANHINAKTCQPELTAEEAKLKAAHQAREFNESFKMNLQNIPQVQDVRQIPVAPMILPILIPGKEVAFEQNQFECDNYAFAVSGDWGPSFDELLKQESNSHQKAVPQPVPQPAPMETNMDRTTMQTAQLLTTLKQLQPVQQIPSADNGQQLNGNGMHRAGKPIANSDHYCSLCGENYDTSGELVMHFKSKKHHDKQKATHMNDNLCNVCKRSYSTLHYLNKHKKSAKHKMNVDAQKGLEEPISEYGKATPTKRNQKQRSAQRKSTAIQ